MKFWGRVLIVLLVGLISFLVIPFRNANEVIPAKAQEPLGQGPFVSEPVTPKLSRAVRQLPILVPLQLDGPGREINPRRRPNTLELSVTDSEVSDPLIQDTSSSLRTPAIITSFNGINANQGGGFVPPDTVGDVGPNHYVQMVNTAFAIYDKNGTLLTGPTAINELWNGAGGRCEVTNDGDPIVLYDPLADRWLLSQFAVTGSPDAECIAISQTPDPTGAYYLYEFPTGAFPDYPKLAVWPDAYYMSANEASYTAYAFNRTRMLAGKSATFQKFTGQTNFLLPGDLDGPTPPPAGSPNYFYTFKDNAFHGGADRLEVFAFHVDFGTPANSTFTQVANIPIANFTYTVCGFFVLNCIRQPAPGEKVDAVSEWPMWRLAYRNFGSHETLVGNFTVDVGNDRAGIRWFELRKIGAGAWTLFQEGTHAPDTKNRFMGSIAMDIDGNIALGYSVSSRVLTPSIRYATRLATDPLGTLQAEATLIAGKGVQTNGFNRWGDYSSMSVDPVDECTFWYTNEYYRTTSAAKWRTRIGAFKISSCSVKASAIGTRQIYLPIILK